MKNLYPTFQNPLLIKPSRPLPKEAAIIGAGTIGPDIGYYLKSALPGITLYLVDVIEKPLQKAKERLEKYAAKAVQRKKMSEDKAAAVLENIVYTTDYEELKNCELVIEAATESIPLKHKIFEMLENIVAEDAIITSNTSSIPAERLFKQMKRPGRTSVTHFFAPAWRSLPVEIINWEGADQEVLDYLFWFFARTGKAPIMTDDAICFILDRVFDNWCNEAAYLLEDATAAQIDKIAEEFVFAGPFFVLNMANGNPIIVETNTLQMEEGEHYRPASILNSVDRWNIPRPGSPTEVPGETKSLIRDRMLGILFSQSFDIVDRGIGTKSDLNLGCQIALGFRQGSLDVMRKLGEKEVRRIMDKFQEERPGFPQPKQPIAEYFDFRRFALVDDVKGVKIITIRRPQAMNALNDEITGEILSVLEQYADDPEVKGFVITGYGTSAFSAGADIGKFPEMLGDSEASAQYARDCAKVQRFMDGMNKPVVAAVNGLAMGGGLEIAIRCHALIAMETSVLQFPEISLGILPGIGGCVIPYRRWPQGAELFNDMITKGKAIKASQALEIGMVDQLAGDYQQLIALAVEKALSMKPSPPAETTVEIPEMTVSEDTRLSKEAVSITIDTIKKAAAVANLDEALEIGYRGFGKIACSEAAKEGISAFLQKRKPDFKK